MATLLAVITYHSVINIFHGYTFCVGEGRSITRLTMLLGYTCMSEEVNIVYQRGKY